MYSKRSAVKTSECENVAKNNKRKAIPLSGALSEKSNISITSESKKFNAAALAGTLGPDFENMKVNV